MAQIMSLVVALQAASVSAGRPSEMLKVLAQEAVASTRALADKLAAALGSSIAGCAWDGACASMGTCSAAPRRWCRSNSCSQRRTWRARRLQPDAELPGQVRVHIHLGKLLELDEAELDARLAAAATQLAGDDSDAAADVAAGAAAGAPAPSAAAASSGAAGADPADDDGSSEAEGGDAAAGAQRGLLQAGGVRVSSAERVLRNLSVSQRGTHAAEMTQPQTPAVPVRRAGANGGRCALDFRSWSTPRAPRRRARWRRRSRRRAPS